MKNTFYSVWNDIKRSKIFTILFCIEILVVIIVVAVFMTAALVENNYLSLYDEKNRDMSLVSIGWQSDFNELDGKVGFEDAAYGINDYSSKEGALTIINYNAAKHFMVKHTGEWFSGNESNEYSETLVSPTLKKKYLIGGTYELPIYGNISYKIKVIGYLDSKDTAITLSSATSFDGIFGERKILICDSRLIEKSGVKCVAVFGNNAQFYADNYNLWATTLGERYESYKVDSKDGRHYSSLILGLLFAIVTVCILCNSIFKTEHDIKRNMIKFVVGNSNKNIIIGEIIKCSITYVIPFVLATCITTAMSIAAIAGKTVSIVTWANFAISASVVLGVYVLATIFSLIRVITAKPLEELRRM